MKFGQGQFSGRMEDMRLLTGKGRYVDDIAPAAAWAVWFARSNHAHARITQLDLTEARAAPGVHLVAGADDLAAMGVDLNQPGMLVETRDGGEGAAPERPLLARDTLRYVGEAYAVIVADTLDQARDAAELIGLDVQDLDPVTTLTPGAPTIHPEAPDNLAFDYGIGDEVGTDTALAKAAHRISLDVIHNRVFPASMEPRGAWAEVLDGRLHVCLNGQGVWGPRKEIARALGIATDDLRITNPDVGGGFGMKGMMYPEYTTLAALARHLNHPVRWMSDRSEACMTDTGGRDLVARAQMGFDDQHRLTAYRVDLVCNLGAYNSQFAQAIQTELFSKVLTGVYDIPHAWLGAKGVYTNTTPIDAYRGAGRPEANLTIERVMDHAARVLGVDPFALREKNVIRSFPYPLISGESVDCGDFDHILRASFGHADVAGFPARRKASEAQGKLRGLGLACYLEAILGSPTETARVVLEGAGATLYVGTQSNGQGHETVYARMLSAQTGIDPQAIKVVQGDSDLIPQGGGTGGSRSVTTQGTAMKATSEALVASLAAFLTEDLGQPVTFADKVFAGPGNLRLTMVEAADLARQKGRIDLLDQSRTTTIAGGAYPNGAHICEVEIDPETGALLMDRYTVVDDFGVLMAPDLVLGQIQGGVAQGYGQAVGENVVYDNQGQLLTGSFMDYAMPRADDLPFIRFFHEGVPTQTNPLGMKGCGEAGTVGACGAISNAVLDALAGRGVTRVDMPFTPQRIWTWLQEAQPAAL